MTIISGWPRLRFCEAPDVDSVTRLDLHNAGIEFNGETRTLADGFSYGVPSVSSPAGARVQVLGPRTSRLPLRVAGTKPAALAKLNAVVRELLRPTNWLEVQLAAEAEPRWLRTWATVPEPVDLSLVWDDPDRTDHWTAALPIAGDPLWIGPEQDLGDWTITNNPSSGAQPMRVVLPEIDGEAAAPLLVKATKSAAGGMFGPAVGVARSEPVVAAAPDSWGAAVAAPVTDATYLAGAYRQTTGGLADWTAVGTWTPDVPDGVDYTRWVAALRVSGTTSQGAFRLRWRVQAAGISSVVYSQPVVVDVEQQPRWVTAGDVPCPMLDLTGLGVTADTTLTLEVERITSGGELRFDGTLMLIPGGPDADLLMLSPDPISTAGVMFLVDADLRRAGMAVGIAPARTPGVAGGWPYVVPGQDNVLTFWQSLDPTIGSGIVDSITSTAAVSVSYRPRYVWGV